MKFRSHSELINSLPYIPKDLIQNLLKASDLAGGKRIALVGGIVRDQLILSILKQPANKIKDIDLIVEDSPQKLAEHIKQLLGDKRVVIHKINHSFQTVELTIDDFAIDIARARKEKYSTLAKNPEINPTSIEDDLFRRDFTINSMALDLRSNKLIDHYKGENAISKRKIDFIHSKSVAEDPTRVIRAARYSTRLNFELSQESLNQLKSTINSWPWDYLKEKESKYIPEALSSRLGMELKLLFEIEDDWEGAMKKLQEWGALTLIDQKIQNDKTWEQRINWAFRLGINPITALISKANSPSHLAERLQLPQAEKELLIESREINKHFHSLYLTKTTKGWAPSRWCKEIESPNWKAESIAITICLKNPLWRYLFKWWWKWRFIKAKATGKELLLNGWTQGPKLGEELKRLRDIELNKYQKK